MRDDALVQIRRAIERTLADLPVQAPVVVGVSGGADSLALARAAASLPRPVVAVVVDHQLQSDSADVAEEAAAVCRALGCADVRVVPVEVPLGPGTGGVEASARHARRTALEEVARAVGSPAVLLGHTADDQAETVLLRLARGSGARSLSAMAEVAGLWRRPLLGLPRSVVRASVVDLQTWSDPHNDDPRFARVRVRRTAMPALVDAVGPAAVEGLVRSARLLRDDADALDAWAEQARVSSEEDGGTLEIDALVALPRAVRTRVIRAAAIDAGCPATDLTAEHIARIDALISDWHGQGPVDLPGGIAGQRECGRLGFARIPPVAVRRHKREET